MPTKRTIFPPDAAVLEVSQESGTGSFALELLWLLCCRDGGFPGGPFPRLCFLGCRSAICSDLVFFFVSGFDVPRSSYCSKSTAVCVALADISKPSSDSGVSARSSRLLSADCWGVDTIWHEVRMKWAWVYWPLCSWSKHFSSALKASMSLCPASMKDLASSACEVVSRYPQLRVCVRLPQPKLSIIPR